MTWQEQWGDVVDAIASSKSRLHASVRVSNLRGYVVNWENIAKAFRRYGLLSASEYLGSGTVNDLETVEVLSYFILLERAEPDV